MTISEKCKILQNWEFENPFTVASYYTALEKMDDIIRNYGDYLITEPIDCDKELERLQKADYELCCALLTMLLREDHFSNGSFERRCKAGTLKPLLDRMIFLLSNKQ